VVDCVVEIPLPGRTFCGSTARAVPITMPTFVAGPENRLLAGTVNRVLPPDSTDEPEPTDAPAAALVLPAILAIHGPSGAGKTHLALGLVRRWHDTYGSESAEYFTSQDFRRGLIDAIQAEAVAEFRRHIRSRRLLVIEDLDRLPSDDYLQQELRYTIDSSAENGGLLVVTSTRAVPALRNLALDVQSRLAAGLAVAATPPDQAARKQILLDASALLGKQLADEAADRLAAAITRTANDLFGALFEFRALRSKLPASDLASVDQYLAGRHSRRPSIRTIVQRVAKYYRLPQNVLKSGSRRQSVVFARAVAIYFARELAGLSYERIGHELGGRDHTTIMHSYRKISERLEHDRPTREAVEELHNSLATTGPG
jgi:chromosomal replication initiator protein